MFQESLIVAVKLLVVAGHALESAGNFYCCAHCAREAGVEGLRDRTA